MLSLGYSCIWFYYYKLSDSLERLVFAPVEAQYLFCYYLSEKLPVMPTVVVFVK